MPTEGEYRHPRCLTHVEDKSEVEPKMSPEPPCRSEPKLLSAALSLGNTT